MGIEPFLISSSILAVVAQRLVRRLCDACKQIYTPTKDMIKTVGLTLEQAERITFYKPVGCDKCLNLGYKGRLPIFEIMMMTNALSKLIIDKADAHALRLQALKDGMTLLIQDGVWKIEQGLTTIEEVLSVSTMQEDV
jgi:type II secretory ATPase GspE/PulE/Tfp pilus assembly ATPase PilB-like protein